MKLLLVTCIQEYEKEVKQVLKHQGVTSFSFQTVNGYSNNQDQDAWFVSEKIATDSLLFTVFIENDCLEELFGRFKQFNDKQTVNSKIHIACLDVNKSL